MDDQAVREHEEQLRSMAVVEPGFLLDCLKPHSTVSACSNPDVSVGFYLIRCSLDGIREADFIRLISDLFIQYALPKKDYQNLRTEDLRKLYRKARSRYTEADNAGELGEIILFALLETERGAPQVINKMSLKTSGQVHVLGLDAIHLGVKNKEICRYYGESKTGPNYNAGIGEAVKDISAYYDRPARLQFELDLISDHIDISRFGDYTKQVLDFFDPYTRDQTSIREVNAIFVGFNWDSILASSAPKIEEKLEAAIASKSDEICRKCVSKIQDSSIKNRTEFFFIPFENINLARKAFREEIG